MVAGAKLGVLGVLYILGELLKGSADRFGEGWWIVEFIQLVVLAAGFALVLARITRLETEVTDLRGRLDAVAQEVRKALGHVVRWAA